MIASGVTLWRGLTSIGTILYSFGRSGTTWKLYSISPSTRVATAVNTASSANNFGISNFQRTGGLTASGSTIYSIVGITGNEAAFVSIPTTGTNRGIATVIRSSLFGTNRLTTTFGAPLRGMETFGGVYQAIVFGAIRSTSTADAWAVLNISSTGTVTVIQGSSTANEARNYHSITQFAVAKPVFQRIPVQSVQEGQPINFDLSIYISGASSYSLGFFRAITTGAPSFPIQISAGAVITGTMGNENAPLVNANSYYSLIVNATNVAGTTSQDITIAVLNSPPLWSAVPPQFINEGSTINFSVCLLYTSPSPRD